MIEKLHSILVERDSIFQISEVLANCVFDRLDDEATEELREDVEIRVRTRHDLFLQLGPFFEGYEETFSESGEGGSVAAKRGVGSGGVYQDGDTELGNVSWTGRGTGK